jgi:hypothetical protein
MISGAMPIVLSLGNLVIVLVACLGLGEALSRWIHPCPDVGLKIGWGISVLLAVGGGLIAIDGSTPSVLASMLGIGVLLFVALEKWRRSVPFAMILFGAAVCLAFLLASIVVITSREPCDDHLAYFSFVERLRETGGLIEPFSLRRLTSYGGQSFLQELTTLASDWHQDMAVEMGLSPIIIFLLLLGAGAKRGTYILGFAVIAYLLTMVFGDIRINSGSEATSVVLILTLLRTLRIMEKGEASNKLLAVAGMVAAGLCSLRNNNIAIPVLLFPLFTLSRRRLFDWRGYCVDGLVFGLAAIACLAPWMVALQRSSGTPIYPLIDGFRHPDFQIYTMGWSIGVWLSHLWGVAAYMPMTLVIAAAASAFSRNTLCRLAFFVAIVTGVASVAAFTSTVPFSLARYTYPAIVAATLFALIVTVTERVPLGPRWEKVLAGIGLLLISFHLVSLARALPPEISARDKSYDARIDLYRRAQAQVPPGESIFVYVAGPFAFDMARNPIINLDMPGPVSPPPGMPFFQGPDALVQYLHTLGIRYVIYDDFDSPEILALNRCVSSAEWQKSRFADEPYARALAPYALDAMANLSALRTTGRVLFDEVNIVTVEP